MPTYLAYQIWLIFKGFVFHFLQWAKMTHKKGKVLGANKAKFEECHIYCMLAVVRNQELSIQVISFHTLQLPETDTRLLSEVILTYGRPKGYMRGRGILSRLG